MATTLRAFNIGLYEEHLEEISFLYEQRSALLNKPEFGWRDLAPVESRLEAHVDALVVGGELALEVCRGVALEGDFGQLFGAVGVYCRQRQVSLLAALLKGLDFANPKKVKALADALRFELPADWSTFIVQALARRDPRLTPVLAAVSGHLRLMPAEPAIVEALGHDTLGGPALVEALGRLRSPQAETTLSTHLSHASQAVRATALLALLRCGSVHALETSLPLAGQGQWTHLPLALSAGRSATGPLLQALQAAPRMGDSLLALGLLGDTAALRTLYDHLEDPALADAAALALHWTTGAGLDEEVFVPEEVDEALLFKHELDAWKQYKQAPKRLDGQPFGEMSRKLSVDKEAWKQWFAANASRFDPALRYRKGVPVTPATLLADLAAAGSSHRLRHFSALELEIRYGCDIPFEVDMPVQAQVSAIRRIAEWVRASQARFEPGRWYFNGQLQ